MKTLGTCCFPASTFGTGSTLASIRIGAAVTWGRSSTGCISLKTHHGLASQFKHLRCGIGVVCKWEMTARGCSMVAMD